MNTETIPTTAPLFQKGQQVLATKGTITFGGEVLLVVVINGKPATYVVQSKAGFHESFDESQLQAI